MKTERNKAKVSRDLGPKGKASDRRKAIVHKTPDSLMPDVPGLCANPMASHQGLAPGHHRTSKRQIAVGASDRLFKAKPWAGATSDEWSGEAPALDRAALLRGVGADHFGEGQRPDGAEIGLIADAFKAEAGQGPERAALKRECDRLIKAGSVRAEAIAEALGF